MEIGQIKSVVKIPEISQSSVDFGAQMLTRSDILNLSEGHST
jgi:hypothetical protein